jgi:hypothetical protein
VEKERSSEERINEIKIKKSTQEGEKHERKQKEYVRRN